jgi:replicative DNA helicase
MRLPSPEALLLSSILNTGDLSEALGRGVSPEHFTGYRPEYEFLTRYSHDYHDIPGVDVLLGIFPEFPYRSAATEVPFYADQVIERANHRTVKAAVLRSADHLAAGDLGAALTEMRSVQVSAATLPPTDAIRSHLVADELDSEREISVPYPWATLQKHTGGMWPGDYCVYAARTTVGKSWGLIYTAATAAMLGHTCCYYSLEMPVAQIVARVHSVIGNLLGYRISHTALHQRTVDQILYKRLLADMEVKVPGSFQVIDTGSGRISPTSISASAGVDLILIDHLGLMSLSDGRRAIDDWRVMASVSNQIKEIAIATRVPVLAASQVNREGARGLKLPGIVDLAQSDSIGQDSDVLVTMRRMAGPAMKYALPKNRHGPNDAIFYSRFEPDYGRLNEISKETAEDLSDTAQTE